MDVFDMLREETAALDVSETALCRALEDIRQLQAQLATVTAERDELKARADAADEECRMAQERVQRLVDANQVLSEKLRATHEALDDAMPFTECTYHDDEIERRAEDAILKSRAILDGKPGNTP